MKITSQEEYGLRCLLQLAQTDAERGMTVKEIAKLEGLSPAYVEKLLRLLAKGGILHSVRGIHGGYLLSRQPKTISLGDVVRALGSLPDTEEICERHPGNRKNCVHLSDCGIRSAWATLTDTIKGFMEKVHVSDLVGAEKQARRSMQRMTTSFSV